MFEEKNLIIKVLAKIFWIASFCRRVEREDNRNRSELCDREDRIWRETMRQNHSDYVKQIETSKAIMERPLTVLSWRPQS